MIRASVAAAVAALALAGCGGDDEKGKTATAGQDTATQTETTDSARTATTETSGTTSTTGTATSPEDQPGGAGDEEAARSQALFTGQGGRVMPSVIRVPAYIAIRVVLRSGDGGSYALRFNGRILRVGGDKKSVSADFAGLRPGKVLAGTGVDGTNAVRVEATAEPGP